MGKHSVVLLSSLLCCANSSIFQLGCCWQQISGDKAYTLILTRACSAALKENQESRSDSAHTQHYEAYASSSVRRTSEWMMDETDDYEQSTQDTLLRLLCRFDWTRSCCMYYSSVVFFAMLRANSSIQKKKTDA
eukprot:scaffold62124_cov21-Prasinocladus_malaysianus.AAC.1